MYYNSYQVYMNHVSTANGTSNLDQYHMLELINVSHSGPIIPISKQSCWSKLTGSTPKGLILKDVSLEIHSGELMAILGSKGSGKKALIDIIGHRVASETATKGQILLNDVPLTSRLFQEQCGFVSKRTQFIQGLTVKQTLSYTAQMTLKTISSIKRARVKQVLSDLALNPFSNRTVDQLNLSELKRLAIGLQLVRDPLLLVLDDPTADLDPLNTYFVISILSNHAKKYGRIVLLTMDKPRSDIFPFLDRITYLCLGDTVYTGYTKLMMDYFRSIGFACPELENPLMYYLCLSTVDRRSRDRFIESSAQIAALVDKFKLEGLECGKQHQQDLSNRSNANGTSNNNQPTIPLTAYGKASSCTIFFTLIARQLSSTFTAGALFRRVLLLPIAFLAMFTFILPRLEMYQHSFQTRSFLLFNCMAIINFITPAITAYHFHSHRNRFYEECSRLALYRGPMFVLTQILTSIPFNIITIWLAGSSIYWLTPMRIDEFWIERWSIFCGVLCAVHIFAEQFTMALLCFIKSPFKCALASIYIINCSLIAGSGLLKNTISTGDWLSYFNYANIYYYSSWTLHFNEFHNNALMERNPALGEDLSSILPCPANVVPGKCMFINGTHFLAHRFKEGIEASKGLLPEWSLFFWKNFGLVYIFILGSYAINTIVYILPLKASLKAKFRD